MPAQVNQRVWFSITNKSVFPIQKPVIGLLPLVLTVSIFSGCQNGMSGLPNLSNLNNPSRVPPPATGSYSVPAGYTNGVSGSGVPIGTGAFNGTGISPNGTTLSSLRSLESGIPTEGVFGSEGTLAAEVQSKAIKSKPVIGQAVSPEKVRGMQFDRSLEAKDAAFQDDGSAEMVVVAAAQQELPDPRAGIAAASKSGSGLTSNVNSPASDNVVWRGPKK